MNKICTSLEQSKKLMELGIDVDTADMCLTFVNNVWNPVWGKVDDIYKLQKDCYEPDYTKDDYVDIDEFEPKVVPCWSLTALLELIPPGNILLRDALSGKYKCINTVDSNLYDNPVDAAFEMIIWLKESKKI